MRLLSILCCCCLQISVAQPGFNKGYDFGYFFNYFNDVTIQSDTIIAYGLAQDTNGTYQQGVLIARFDTSGNHLDHVLVLDTTNNIYSIDKHWGKIIATSDGGYAMTTATLYGGDAVFIKLDRSLEIEFVQRFRDTTTRGEFLLGPVEIPEGYLLYGYYNHPSNNKFDAILRKVDKQGNMIWRKNYGLYDWYESFNVATLQGDSLLIISGRKVFDVFVPGTSKPWVSAYNLQGELQWEWTSNNNALYAGITLARFFPQADSSWMVLGNKFLGKDPEFGFEKYQYYWVKLDRHFQFQWAKTFGPTTTPSNGFFQIIQSAQGNFTGIGRRNSFNPQVEGYYQKGWVMRFSPEADSLWEWAEKLPIASPGEHFFSGGAMLSSGSIVAAGRGEGPTGRGYGWLVKLSPDGCLDTLFCHPTVAAPEPPSSSQSVFELYPNPAQDHLEVRFSNGEIPEDARLLLRDLQGRLLRSFELSVSGQFLRLEGVPVGVYFVQLVSGKAGVLGVKKLVVTR